MSAALFLSPSIRGDCPEVSSGTLSKSPTGRFLSPFPRSFLLSSALEFPESSSGSFSATPSFGGSTSIETSSSILLFAAACSSSWPGGSPATISSPSSGGTSTFLRRRRCFSSRSLPSSEAANNPAILNLQASVCGTLVRPFASTMRHASHPGDIPYFSMSALRTYIFLSCGARTVTGVSGNSLETASLPETNFCLGLLA